MNKILLYSQVIGCLLLAYLYWNATHATYHGDAAGNGMASGFAWIGIWSALAIQSIFVAVAWWSWLQKAGVGPIASLALVVFGLGFVFLGIVTLPAIMGPMTVVVGFLPFVITPFFPAISWKPILFVFFGFLVFGSIIHQFQGKGRIFKMVTGKRAWNTGVSFAPPFPVHILQASLYNSSGEVGPVDEHHPFGTWGPTYSGMTAKVMAFPEKLEVKWFSFRENKFYAGNFDLKLPLEKMELITKDSDSNQQLTFTIGLAPGGAVALWVRDGSKDETFVVGHFRGTEAMVNWSEMGINMDRDQFVKSHLKQMDELHSYTETELAEKIKPEYWEGLLHNSK